MAFAPFMRWNFEADRWKNVPYHVGDARVPKRGVYGRDRSNLRDIRFEPKDDGNIKREHVCSPNDPETVKRIFDIIEAEREDLQRYRDELERYKELDKHLENAST